VTSIEASTPPRSPRQPLYYVQSPSHSQQDLEKMSYGSSAFGSPTHHYHCSPIHPSREFSTSRFSACLKNP
ncbi:Late embryogenesis abundant, partial [Olea europaea subsp. europaea]